MQSAKEKGVSFLELAAERIEEATGHEYETAIWRLNATEFGVPQDRTRFFIVGWRHGHVAPAMPAAEYQDRSSRDYDLDALPPITLHEAIHDLPPLAAGEGTAVAPLQLTPDEKVARRYLRKFKMRGGQLLYGHSVRYHNERDIELYGLLEPGENSVDAIERHGRADLMRYRTDVFDDKYSRLRPDRPGKTIVAHLAKDGNGYIHPEQARSLTLREAARVQSFEDSYVFCGTPSEQWTQLGNSVPPVMAEAIARSFLRALEVENSR
jgi:DNA (cytosine-5)-methyltransferase 1